MEAGTCVEWMCGDFQHLSEFLSEVLIFSHQQLASGTSAVIVLATTKKKVIYILIITLTDRTLFNIGQLIKLENPGKKDSSRMLISVRLCLFGTIWS